MASTNTADIIARRLYEAGCRYAFGIPGGEVLTLIDALDRVGLRFVLTKHENSAGFMAEGIYQRSGAPGVLVATLGPGAANAVNVVANAEQDRVPLIFITGCIDAEEADSYTHQVIDHAALFGPITKASFRMNAGNAALLIDKAVSIALEDRPGPVHIDLPISVAAAIQDGTRTWSANVMPAPVQPAVGPDLEQARAWMAEAKRPIMVAGLDVMNHGASETLAAFAADFGVPLITTYKAKGVLPEDHPMALAGAGLSPVADKVLLPLAQQADLILLAGYDPVEMRTGWKHAWDPAQQRVVEFAATSNRHYMHQASLSFVCDVGAGLTALRDGLTPNGTWPDGEPARAKQALLETFNPNEAWGPAAVVSTVRGALPRDGIATADSGAHRILLSQIWEAYEPRSLLQSSGFCTMGCALPLAMGAKLAAPERPTVVFTGDACLEMILGELATLRDLALPLVIVVFVDASLALIELKQRARGLKRVGVGFGRTDFEAVAAAFGGRGVTVDNREDLTQAMEAALAAERFTIIGCEIDAGAYEGRI